MKKLKMAICGVIAATVLITGCSSGVSQEEYDKVVVDSVR